MDGWVVVLSDTYIYVVQYVGGLAGWVVEIWYCQNVGGHYLPVGESPLSRTGNGELATTTAQNP